MSPFPFPRKQQEEQEDQQQEQQEEDLDLEEAPVVVEDEQEQHHGAAVVEEDEDITDDDDDSLTDVYTTDGTYVPTPGTCPRPTAAILIAGNSNSKNSSSANEASDVDAEEDVAAGAAEDTEDCDLSGGVDYDYDAAYNNNDLTEDGMVSEADNVSGVSSLYNGPGLYHHTNNNNNNTMNDVDADASILTDHEIFRASLEAEERRIMQDFNFDYSVNLSFDNTINQPYDPTGQPRPSGDDGDHNYGDMSMSVVNSVNTSTETGGAAAAFGIPSSWAPLPPPSEDHRNNNAINNNTTFEDNDNSTLDTNGSSRILRPYKSQSKRGGGTTSGTENGNSSLFERFRARTRPSRNYTTSRVLLRKAPAATANATPNKKGEVTQTESPSPTGSDVFDEAPDAALMGVQAPPYYLQPVATTPRAGNAAKTTSPTTTKSSNSPPSVIVLGFGGDDNNIDGTLQQLRQSRSDGKQPGDDADAAANKGRCCCKTLCGDWLGRAIVVCVLIILAAVGVSVGSLLAANNNSTEPSAATTTTTNANDNNYPPSFGGSEPPGAVVQKTPRPIIYGPPDESDDTTTSGISAVVDAASSFTAEPMPNKLPQATPDPTTSEPTSAPVVVVTTTSPPSTAQPTTKAPTRLPTKLPTTVPPTPRPTLRATLRPTTAEPTEAPEVVVSTEVPVVDPPPVEETLAPTDAEVVDDVVDTGSDDCVDSTTATFFVESNRDNINNENGGMKDCAWLANNPSYQDVLCIERLQAYWSCAKTCGSCTTSAPPNAAGGDDDDDDIQTSVTDPTTVVETAAPAVPPTEAPTEEVVVATTEAPQVTQESQIRSIVTDAISDEAWDTIERNPDSPQARALEWLVSSMGGTSSSWGANNRRTTEYEEVEMDTIIVLQRFALATFYYSTRARDWSTSTSWLQLSSDLSECDWYGIECDDKTGHVTSISLRSNHITGVIPSEIALLSSSLETLDLGNNGLKRRLPAAIEKLSKLTSLQLDDNRIDGPLPDEIGLLTNLQMLHLQYNDFSGAVPSSIYLLSNLRELLLWNNDLTGYVPKEVCEFDNLETLILDCQEIECDCWTRCFYQCGGNTGVRCGDLSGFDPGRVNNGRNGYP